MATETLTCPYCNAAINPETGRTTGQRIVCPRCGDAFTPRSSDAFTNQPLAPATETGITAIPPPVAAPSRWSNRLIAAAVLGIMLIMAGVGLAFMLATQNQRRAYDTSRPPRRPGRQPGLIEPERPAIAAVSPDKLTALGYLPAGINFLFAVRVPELQASPIGAQLLRDPIKFGNSSYRLADLPAWVGLRLEDIDHFVFAARVDKSLIPPFYLVIRTAGPYEEEAMRRRLKAARLAGGTKKCYSFRTPQKDIPLNVWFADARTLVVALFADQLEALPNKPAEDLRHLPDELRDVLTTRREPVAPVWLAGHSRDWTRTTAVKFLNRLKKEDLDKLAPLRTFGVWLVPDKSLDVKAAIGCRDDAGARGLEEYFRTLSRNDPAFKTALDGLWLTLQFRAGPDFLSRLMKR